MEKSRSGRRLVQAAAHFDQIEKEIDGLNSKRRGERKYLALSQTKNRPAPNKIIAAFREAVGDAADQLDNDDIENVRRALDWAHADWLSNESSPNVGKAEQRFFRIHDTATILRGLIAKSNDADPLNAFVARLLRRHADKIVDPDNRDLVTFAAETRFFEDFLSKLRIVEVAAQAGLLEVPSWAAGRP